MPLTVVAEAATRKVATRRLAFEAVAQAFEAIASNKAKILPVILSEGGPPDSGFSVKSATNLADTLLGLKVGSYWPGNRALGVPNHGSTTLLLDDATGFPKALVSAGYLNGLRTAAANAVAVDQLARPDSQVLGIIGGGHQAEFEVRAIIACRPIELVKIWSRTEETSRLIRKKLSDLPVEVVITNCRDTVTGSDVLTTVTSSTQPLVKSSWVERGTHISAMGADQPGKQELSTAVLRGALCFADLPQQSVQIGEFQHAFRDGVIPNLSQIVPIGDVLLGRRPGRQSEDEITVFDSSGVAMQDLYVAQAVVQAAVDIGAALELDF